jgi:geranylgeranyl diphosphate synthase, type II
MDNATRIERSLAQALLLTQSSDAPPLLVSAIRYAVIPGGARIRPKLCLAVARACGDDRPALSATAAAAIELMHCASLVHDDLPCFDAANLRRGKASVHKAFGERLAVLAGDALMVLTFQVMARAGALEPTRLAPLLGIIARTVGAPGGIIGGQAWECEPEIPLQTYHRAKTGALFAAATAAGACAAGHDPASWHELGERIGEAYQIADDIRDVYCSEGDMGKPAGRDAALGRPNRAQQFGIGPSVAHLDELVRSAMDSVPDCPGAKDLRAHIKNEAGRLLPRELARPAA